LGGFTGVMREKNIRTQELKNEGIREYRNTKKEAKGQKWNFYAFMVQKCLVWERKWGYNSVRKGIRKMADLKMDEKTKRIKGNTDKPLL
jgi:hypothetical protein